DDSAPEVGRQAPEKPARAEAEAALGLDAIAHVSRRAPAGRLAHGSYDRGSSSGVDDERRGPRPLGGLSQAAFSPSFPLAVVQSVLFSPVDPAYPLARPERHRVLVCLSSGASP